MSEYQLWDLLHYTWLSNIVKIVKNKEILRNYHRLVEPVTKQLNVYGFVDDILKQENDIR